jgi:hypothetical protein
VSEEQPGPKKRRKLRGYHVMILALLVGIAWFGLYRWRQKRQLQKRTEAIRAAGYPVTLAELDDWYSIPQDADNAAYVILDAASWYVEPNKPRLLPVVGKAKLPNRAQPLPDDTKEAVEAFLTGNGKALEILREAIGMENSRYPIDLSNLYVVLPHLGDIREMAKLMKLAALSHAENNEIKEATVALRTIFAVADSLSGEPQLVSQLSRLADLKVGASATERVVNRCALKEDELVELSKAILPFVKTRGISFGFASERCYILDGFAKAENWDSDWFGDEEIPPLAVLDLYQAIGLFDRAAIVYLDRMGAYLDICRLPEGERLEAAKEIDDRVQSMSGMPEFFRRFVVTFSRSTAIELGATAQMRAALVGLAIERYRLAVGKLPDSLEKLVPAYLDSVPRDPFDGAQLRYKRLEKGYVVYSIGEDGSDDGGKERLPRDQRKDPEDSWDVTFIVER